MSTLLNTALRVAKTCTLLMEITKEGAQSLRMKMPTAELVFERSYSYLRLLPAYSKISRTNVKVVKARLLALVQLRNRGSSFQLSDEYGIVEVQVVEMTEAAATKQASVTTLHVRVVRAFLQK